MDRSDSIAKLAAALCEVQKTELFALTDKENPFFKRKYADLSSVWDAIRLPLTNNGLAVTQTMASHNTDGVTIETTLMHASGEHISGSLYIKPEKNTPQGLGSAITYGRRYALMGIVGIAPEDDDGERAMARRRGNKKEASKTTIQEPDVPSAVVKKPDAKGTETVEEFFVRKKMSKDEVIEFNDYLVESAELLGMDIKTLKRNAEAADDLEDMLESVIKRRDAKEQAKGNWWDQSKHWSFREKDALKELVLYGFGNRNSEDIGESKACVDNPGAYNTLKTALPETKKALVRKFDKLFGSGEFNKLIEK